MRWFRRGISKKQFSEWISLYNAPLFRHALWLTGNRETAYDVVQDTFYQAWENRQNLMHPEKALPWLLTILRRAVYREQRCQCRYQDILDSLSKLPVEPYQPDTSDLLHIAAVLETITTKQRDIFLRHYLHGFSYEEISEQLKIPIGTVMSRIARARQTLQQRHDEANNVIPLRRSTGG